MHGTSRALAAVHWDDVRLFLALCRARTVAEAARALAVDPSTVSRRLAALEEALACTLFERGRDGVRATKAAEDLLPAAEEVERGVARFAGAADALERDVAGLVRVTCPPDVAEVVAVPVVRELLRRHPALRVALEPGESILDLTRREADLALRVVRPKRGDLVVKKLMTVEWVPATSPALADQLGSLGAWDDAPWIGWGERFAGAPACSWLARNAPGVQPALFSDSLSTQLAAAVAGIGVALVPAPSLEHYGLVRVAIDNDLAASAEPWPADSLFVVTHRILRDVPRVRAVWDAMVERLGAGP